MIASGTWVAVTPVGFILENMHQTMRDYAVEMHWHLHSLVGAECGGRKPENTSLTNFEPDSENNTCLIAAETSGAANLTIPEKITKFRKLAPGIGQGLSVFEGVRNRNSMLAIRDRTY